MRHRAGRLRRIHGWGRHPRMEARLRFPQDLESASAPPVLARGLGRAYGDAALPAAAGDPLLATPRADRVLALDPDRGVLRAEAGLALDVLLGLLLARGWRPPVLPGTGRVTLGGMVAADVHGKEHATRGSFGAHVRSLRLRTGGGEVLSVSREREPALFRATIGGMGLTGTILEVELGLARTPVPWVVARRTRVADAAGLVARLEDPDPRWPCRVAWLDLLATGPAFGAGVLHEARWAGPEEEGAAPGAPPRARRAPALPWLPRAGVRAFNARYGRAAHGERAVAPAAFFFPLDRLRDWNRLYGSRGFVQHQAAFPDGDGALACLEAVRARRMPVYLAVMKDLGEQGEGLLSFPRRGITLALDLPRRARTRADIDALNEVVVRRGGRIYLAKDALTRREHFRAMEPRLDSFEQVRRRWDPEGRLRSSLSRRLMEADA